jgi:hypothetical protein
MCDRIKVLRSTGSGRSALSAVITSYLVGKAPFVCGLTSRCWPKQLTAAHGGRFVMSKKSNTIELFGNVGLQRAVCPKCKSYAFVVGGKFTCCGTFFDKKPADYHRVIEPFQHRKTPRNDDKENILDQQGQRCIYCDGAFGNFTIRNGKPLMLELCWDHMLPYNLTQNNYSYNFVAACQICNGIKGSKVFRDLDEARQYIQERRLRKGYRF